MGPREWDCCMWNIFLMRGKPFPLQFSAELTILHYPYSETGNGENGWSGLSSIYIYPLLGFWITSIFFFFKLSRHLCGRILYGVIQESNQKQKRKMRDNMDFLYFWCWKMQTDENFSDQCCLDGFRCEFFFLLPERCCKAFPWIKNNGSVWRWCSFLKGSQREGLICRSFWTHTLHTKTYQRH